MKKRVVFISVLSLMIVVTIFILYWIGYGVYKGKKIWDMNESRIHQREERFKNNPNLLDCMVLLNNYYWDLQQHEKALHYGEYCIRLGVDNTRRGWYVHMLLADIYAKDKNLEEACNNVDFALKAVERNNIPEPHIKELKLQKLIYFCGERAKTRKNQEHIPNKK